MRPAPAHRHVVFGTIVVFLEKNEILTGHPGPVLDVQKPDGSLSLETAHTFEVLGPVGMEFPSVVPEYHTTEELGEGRSLEVDRAVRSHGGSVVTLDSRSGDIANVGIVRLDRFEPAETREVTYPLPG